MNWGCIGVNYKTAPVEVREKFSLFETQWADESSALLELDGVRECVILSTCNRTEFYLELEAPQVLGRVRHHLLERRGLVAEYASHLYQLTGMGVASHLARVHCGLESMVLGETEIAGQVKKAYGFALDHEFSQSSLNRLFQKIFSINKKVRNATGINEGATSVGSVAVELAEKIFGDLEKTSVLILGAGEMSRVTAQSLKSRGASSIFVANRSFDKAVELADKMGGEALRYDKWTEYLCHIDIVIASTSAPHYIVTPELIEPLRSQRKYRSLFLIDISVPRNIHPEVSEIEEVYLYDIDTLAEVADQARKKREQDIRHCETIIETELEKMKESTQKKDIILGSRGSALALAQVEITEHLLAEKCPTLTSKREIIKTTGDIRTDVPLSEVASASGIVDKGVFIKELENALIEKKVDVAVHSLKDMPSELEKEFVLAAILPRAAVSDVIISKHGVGEKALPQGAVVATSSVRRQRMLRHQRPDINVVDIRGNVPTRLDKLALEESWDAILLAEAGLNRLGLTPDVLLQREVPLYVTACDPTKFLPAAGQGAVALEILAENKPLKNRLAPLNDPDTALRVSIERQFLARLGAGCSTPVGVYTSIEGDSLYFKAMIFDESDESCDPQIIEVSGSKNEPDALFEQICSCLN